MAIGFYEMKNALLGIVVFYYELRGMQRKMNRGGAWDGSCGHKIGQSCASRVQCGSGASIACCVNRTSNVLLTCSHR
jgi:hypothetical protein